MSTMQPKCPNAALLQMTDFPPLPTGWTWTTLGDVLPLTYGKALPERSRNGGGAYPVFGSSGPVGTHSHSIAPENAIIIGRKGSAGSVHRSKEPSWPIDTAYFTNGTPAININYAYWLLTYKNLGNLDQSTAIPSLNRDIYSVVRIPLPPLNEQARIVARIDELFTEISNGEAALQSAQVGLDLFRRTTLTAAVNGELTKSWREANQPDDTGHDLLARIQHANRDQRATRQKWTPSANLRPLPKGWAWCAVEEAGDVQLGRQRAPQHHFGAHMRPYLRVANVLEARLDLTDVKTMNFTPEEYETFALRSGDVLLNEGQAPDLLGRPAIYRDEIEECCFQKTLLRFRAKDGVLPEYALIVFRHYMRSGRFKKESRITTNIGHLTQVRFVVMEFPLPPTPEQREIVQRVQQLENEAAQAVGLALSDPPAALRQAILKAAFEGRLVPQDDTDEPAAALLARLKAVVPVPARLRRRRAA